MFDSFFLIIFQMGYNDETACQVGTLNLKGKFKVSFIKVFSVTTSRSCLINYVNRNEFNNLASEFTLQSRLVIIFKANNQSQPRAKEVRSLNLMLINVYSTSNIFKVQFIICGFSILLQVVSRPNAFCTTILTPPRTYNLCTSLSAKDLYRLWCTFYKIRGELPALLAFNIALFTVALVTMSGSFLFFFSLVRSRRSPGAYLKVNMKRKMSAVEEP